MKHLLVINGKPRLYRHFDVYTCKLEQPPTGKYKAYKPGEMYGIVWFRDNTSVIVHGSPEVQTRPSGRLLVSLNGPEFPR